MIEQGHGDVHGAILKQQSQLFKNRSPIEQDTINLSRMTQTLADRVNKRLKTLGLSARAASLAAGMSPAGILNMQRAHRAGRDFNFRADSLAALAKALQTTEAWLLRGEGPEWAKAAPAAEAADDGGALLEPVPAGTTAPHAGEVTAADVAMPARSTMPLDVPVYGTAAGSLDGAFQIDGVVDYVRRPPALVGATGLYAIYVIGQSMAPEHSPGDLRFVHPFRPARRGDTVIVQTRTHEGAPIQAYIKTLDHRTDTKLVVTQRNPEATMELDLRFVVAVHRVLTMNEMFGL